MLFVDINQENTVKEPPVPIIIGYRRLIIGERVSSRSHHTSDFSLFELKIENAEGVASGTREGLARWPKGESQRSGN